MTQRELDLKVIINQFSIWEVNLSNLNSLNLQDANLISEYQMAEVLNCVFGYNLKNANSYGRNYPSIDLVDEANSLAVQVTTTIKVNKIQETLNKFSEHVLYKSYGRLIVLIMGKKQKSYPSLIIPERIAFDPKNDIIDFAVLLQSINYLSTTKLDKLKSIMVKAAITEEKPTFLKVANLQKKAIAMEKKFLRDFVDANLSREDLEYAYYEPRTKLNFGSAIIRDVGDRTFPGGDPKNPKWTKLEFLGLYDYGVEFVREGQDAIFDKDGFWDILVWDDPRGNNLEYKKNRSWIIYRLSYQDMVIYDLEPDSYYGYPTIFCPFKYNGWPWEEIKFGQPGFGKSKQRQFYFDNSKRKKLP